MFAKTLVDSMLIAVPYCGKAFYVVAEMPRTSAVSVPIPSRGMWQTPRLTCCS